MYTVVFGELLNVGMSADEIQDHHVALEHWAGMSVDVLRYVYVKPCGAPGTQKYKKTLSLPFTHQTSFSVSSPFRITLNRM